MRKMAMSLDFVSVEMATKKKVQDDRRGYFLHSGFFLRRFHTRNKNSVCLAATQSDSIEPLETKTISSVPCFIFETYRTRRVYETLILASILRI
jgi:hypothetical protein